MVCNALLSKVQDGLFGTPYGLYTGSNAFETELGVQPPVGPGPTRREVSRVTKKILIMFNHPDGGFQK
jgi:hypothetical protein